MQTQCIMIAIFASCCLASVWVCGATKPEGIMVFLAQSNDCTQRQTIVPTIGLGYPPKRSLDDDDYGYG